MSKRGEDEAGGCQSVVTLSPIFRLDFITLFSGRPWIRIADREQKSRK